MLRFVPWENVYWNICSHILLLEIGNLLHNGLRSNLYCIQGRNVIFSFLTVKSRDFKEHCSKNFAYCTVWKLKETDDDTPFYLFILRFHSNKNALPIDFTIIATKYYAIPRAYIINIIIIIIISSWRPSEYGKIKNYVHYYVASHCWI